MILSASCAWYRSLHARSTRSPASERPSRRGGSALRSPWPEPRSNGLSGVALRGCQRLHPGAQSRGSTGSGVTATPAAKRHPLPPCYRAVALPQLPARKLASNQSTGQPPRRTSLTQEAVMGQPIPAQHPSVVLRSHFNLVRALLIIAMAALLASATAVVILANDEDQVNSAAVSKVRTRGAAATPGRHALRRRSRRGHPRPVRAAPAPGRHALRRRPRRGHPRRAVVLRVPQCALQLSAGSRRWHKGSRRWPDHAPAGSRRSLDPESDIR